MKHGNMLTLKLLLLEYGNPRQLSMPQDTLILPLPVLQKETRIVAPLLRVLHLQQTDRKSTRLNSSHVVTSRMPSSA